MNCYILSAASNCCDIEFVGNWIAGCWNVFYIRNFDECLGGINTEDELFRAECALDDRHRTFVATLPEFTLIFKNRKVFERFKTRCPGFKCNARVASKRDIRYYAL